MAARYSHFRADSLRKAVADMENTRDQAQAKNAKVIPMVNKA